MKGIIWRLQKMESEDIKKSTWPEGISKHREFEKEKKEFHDIIGIFLCIEEGDKEIYLNSLVRRVTDLNSQFYKLNKIVIVPFGHLSNKLEKPKQAKELIDKAVQKLKANGFEVNRVSFGTHKRLLWEIPGQPAAASYFEF